MALYAADGSINVTVVDGTATTGLYAADGSWNVVVSDGVDFAGVYHPCGAYNVTVLESGPAGIFATDGSLYVQESPYTYSGGFRVTVVSGSLGFSLTAPVLTWASAASDNTPLFEGVFTDLQENDVGRLQLSTDAGFSSPTDYTNTADVTEVGLLQLDFTTGALADGQWWARVRHERGGAVSSWSNVVTETIDVTAPTITSATTANNAENSVLAHSLTANESVTWTITGGADSARFEISGSTLRWASNGTKDYETPNDADTNNTYVVQVTATDAATNATNQTITITVTDVAEGGSPPVNTVAPVISGNVQVGETLTTTDGTWTGTATINYTYQWKRDGVNIAGATANTRVLVELDAGAAITCDVTGTNGVGNSTATSNSLTIDVYVVYLSQILDTADATTYSGGSWDAVSLGTAAANRKIVIGYATRRTAGTPSISSGTVGAASGAEITAEEEANGGGVWLWSFANAADATANISTTFADAGQLRLGARLYAVYGADAGTAYHAIESSVDTVSIANVVTPVNGMTIAITYGRAAGSAVVTWTNATGDGTESVIEGAVGVIDSAQRLTAGTVTISAQHAATFIYMAIVAYGPS